MEAESLVISAPLGKLVPGTIDTSLGNIVARFVGSWAAAMRLNPPSLRRGTGVLAWRGCLGVRVLAVPRKGLLHKAQSRDGVGVTSSLRGIRWRRIREEIRRCRLEPRFESFWC